MITLLPIPIAFSRLRKSRSGGYADIKAGLLPRPVKTGLRASCLPDDEVDAINRARIAGKTDDEIRALVLRLYANRV